TRLLPAPPTRRSSELALEEPLELRIRPGEVPLAGRRIDPVPGDAVANRFDAELRHQLQIRAPVLVVLGQLVLVQRASGLLERSRDERVLDSGEPTPLQVVRRRSGLGHGWADAR